MHIIGSKTSTTEEFLKAVSPKIALIGVGQDNSFGHPNKQIIERLQGNGVKIFRTDQAGEISIEVNETMLKIVCILQKELFI